MSVLLFRPENKLQRSCSVFKSAGIHSVGIPLIRTLENQATLQSLEHRLQTLPANTKIIVTSTSAASLISKSVKHWPKYLETICVGHSTAAILQAHGIGSIVPDIESSEGLLDLPALQANCLGNVVILKGTGGRKTLANSLVERGADLVQIDLYSRERITSPQPTELWNADEIQCIIATSGELIEAAFDVLESQWLRKMPWVVVSQRTADIATKLGIENILVSKSANDAALIDTTMKYLEQ